MPIPPIARNSTGYAPGCHSSPVSFARAAMRSPGSPAAASPERSPLISATNTGTPAADSCSVISCSVLVLPVPVAPATRPCRFSMPKGTRTLAVGCAAPAATTEPSSIAGAPPNPYPAAIRAATSAPGTSAGAGSADRLLAAVAGGTAALAGTAPLGVSPHEPSSLGLREDQCDPPVAAGPPDGPATRVDGVADRASDRLVWGDCEMTGLDLRRDALIEIAVLVTNSDLRILDAGVDIVIKAPDELLDGMLPVVRDMHAASGLTEAVRVSAVTTAEAEQIVVDYLRKHVADPRTAPLCGNSIATDRAFLARDMPTLDGFLHYRMIDVSSIKELARRWYPRVYFAQPQKGLAHRALADIRESIRELRYYRKTIFAPLPGPSSEEAQKAAAEAVGEDTA